MNIDALHVMLVSLVSEREKAHQMVHGFSTAPADFVTFIDSKLQEARNALTFVQQLRDAPSGVLLESDPQVSLRAYFMAHAPERPHWFEPTMPPQPTVPDPHRELTDEQWQDFNGLGDCISDEEAGPFVVEFAQRYADAVNAYEAWRLERERQTLAQWPRTWADLMIVEHDRTNAGQVQG